MLCLITSTSVSVIISSSDLGVMAHHAQAMMEEPFPYILCYGSVV